MDPQLQNFFQTIAKGDVNTSMLLKEARDLESSVSAGLSADFWIMYMLLSMTEGHVLEAVHMHSRLNKLVSDHRHNDIVVAVGKAMRDLDYGRAIAVLMASTTLGPLGDAMVVKYRELALKTVAQTYSSIQVEYLGDKVGLSRDDTLSLVQEHLWTLKGDVVLPRKFNAPVVACPTLTIESLTYSILNLERATLPTASVERRANEPSPHVEHKE